jgi:hypothetical protein
MSAKSLSSPLFSLITSALISQLLIPVCLPGRFLRQVVEEGTENASYYNNGKGIENEGEFSKDHSPSASLVAFPVILISFPKLK